MQWIGDCIRAGNRFLIRVLKTIISLIEPVGMSWLILTAVLLWHAWRRRLRPACLIAVPWLLMTAVFCTPLPSVLLATLERPWVPVDVAGLPGVDAVVSLGGAGEPSGLEITGFHFTRGTDRVMTAVELVRRGKAGTLVFGGGGYGDEAAWLSEADRVKSWIDSWSVLKNPVLSLGVCADTHDEALKTAAMAREHGWKRIILVTSASHMNRAEATFKKAGLDVVCAPCNVISSVFREKHLSWFHAPHHSGMEVFSIWFHEVLGTLAYRLRGWI